jgi:hypothetical protein
MATKKKAEKEGAAQKKRKIKALRMKDLQIRDVAGNAILNRETNVLRAGPKVICYSSRAKTMPW